MAADLTIHAGWTPAQVNTVLSRHTFTNWSMAPIAWDGTGMASQHLFLFQPDEEGCVQVDEAEFRSLFESTWR